MFEISPQKQEVISAEGHVLVMGGPGSGKTTAALLKAHSIIESGIFRRWQKVLFLSFARATVSRVEQQAKDVLGQATTASIEVSTYHSFAWNILKSHGYLLVPHEIRLLPPHEASVKLSDAQDKVSEKIRLLQEEGLLHFDLFAAKCAELLSRSKALLDIISDAYPVVILDEFQDTNEDEWKLITQLGQKSALVVLADPEQRIYDFRGASPARIGQFIQTFSPRPFDFGTENNRSNGTDIVTFGNDLLTGANKGKKYNDVEIFGYVPLKNDGQLLDLKKHLIKRKKENQSNNNWSLAVLVPSNDVMIAVSEFLGSRQKFLDGKILPALHHDVAVDTAGPALAATLIGTLLEDASQQKSTAIRLISRLIDHILGRRGDNTVSKSDQELAKALSGYISRDDTKRAIAGKTRKVLVEECIRISDTCNSLDFTGDVAMDWLSVRKVLSEAQSESLQVLSRDAGFIRLFHKGSVLNGSLGQIWRANANYSGATAAIQNALTQEHFSMATKTWSGVNVMTIHKSKGKEFDEVIIYEGPYRGKLVVRDDTDKARLNLRVAVTRAKKNVIILTPSKDPCCLL